MGISGGISGGISEITKLSVMNGTLSMLDKKIKMEDGTQDRASVLM